MDDAPRDDAALIRIGDAERDEAVGLLQGHLTAGRLNNDEFDERISAALKARTQADLAPLFRDLPGRRPGSTATPESVPEPVPDSDTAVEEHRPTPIWAHWALLPIAVMLTAVTRGNIGLLIPLVAMWVFWIYPSYVAPRRRRSSVELTARDLTTAQRREITDLIDSGSRVAAVKRYRELTGAGLRDAKVAVDTWDHQLGR